MEKVMEKVENKITKEELDNIVKQQSLVNEILLKVGYADAQKHQYLHDLSIVNKDIEELKLDLEKKYGNVNIDMGTGEYTKIESDEGNKED
jgi:hypothetical protein